jgi:DNA-binding NtrC family response regulator
LIREPQAASSLPAPRTPSRPAHTLLIVDDDALVLDLLSELLRDNDYRLITAGSGEEALTKINASPIDIAIVDCKMPGMNGLETIERITEISPEVVSILMTAFPTIDSSIKAIKLGASDYLLKPFKLDEVELAIERAIKERELRREMKNLRTRVSELEKGISDKKENIKVNDKVEKISATQRLRITPQYKNGNRPER